MAKAEAVATHDNTGVTSMRLPALLAAMFPILLAGCLDPTPRQTAWQTTDGRPVATATGHMDTSDRQLYDRFSAANTECLQQHYAAPAPQAPTVMQGILNPGYVATQNPTARYERHMETCMGQRGFVARLS